MANSPHHRFPVANRSYLNLAKQGITRLAEECGLTPAEVGKVAIVVSELASNLIKHTPQGGELLAKPLAEDETAGIEILSLDNGAGMRDPNRMMEDGVSTAGSMGEGLGAIRRLSDEFDLYSGPDLGTVILSRLYRGGRAPKSPRSGSFRAIMVPLAGESVSGDGWALTGPPERRALLVVDGLGHGPEAHLAASEAIRVFTREAGGPPAGVLRILHDSLRPTRGAVGMVAVLSPAENRLVHCGVGNVAGRLFFPDGAAHLISYHGTLGYSLPNPLTDHPSPWNESAVLVVHSDGLKTKWDLRKYPGLPRHDPSVIAGVLYKDHTRKTDDVLVVVGKRNQ
ncbi:MAG: ATP-binding protein [Ferruginibacter sp.]|nr:ATP-binding protein [Cytophagales bacterium]